MKLLVIALCLSNALSAVAFASANDAQEMPATTKAELLSDAVVKGALAPYASCGEEFAAVSKTRAQVAYCCPGNPALYVHVDATYDSSSQKTADASVVIEKSLLGCTK